MSRPASGGNPYLNLGMLALVVAAMCLLPMMTSPYYAAGQVLQAAVEKLGEPPSLSEEARGKLNELIAGTDLRTFYGPIKFATEGDHFHNNTALSPMLVQIQGGQVKAIAPPDAAEAKIIYPLTPLG